MSSGPGGEGVRATVVTGAEVFAPQPLGRTDVLVLGSTVAHVAPGIRPERGWVPCAVREASGLILVPGLVDGHVHILGGGGEGGPATRAPEISPAALAAAGITTVVGLLGFDGVTRHVTDLLAKARALDEAGLTAHIYTGAYQLPLQTITGDVERDLVLIDKVLGCGEVAVSDHRSSEPEPEDLVRVAASVHVGGILAGKAGVLHLHIGGGRRRLDPVLRALEIADLPPRVFFPTHVNRSPRLLGQAADAARRGCAVDLTATVAPDCDEPGSVPPDEALAWLLGAGVPLRRITLSSDGNGSMPTFDGQGRLVSIAVAPVALLWSRVRDAVLRWGIPLPDALATVTANPAGVLGLAPAKGRIAPGSDADLLLLDQDLNVVEVWARGRVVFAGGRPLVADPFSGAGAGAEAGADDRRANGHAVRASAPLPLGGAPRSDAATADRQRP